MSVVSRDPCDVCGSSDNQVTHENGSVWCYTTDCQSNIGRHRVQVEDAPRTPSNLLEGSYSALPARRISQKTCEFFGYMVGLDNGFPVQIASYGAAQKIRTKDKSFYWKGDNKGAGLFGKHKWSGKGKSIVITEGEIDCLSIAETQDCKWPVVSLPNGAQSARKTLQAELDWLLGYDNIVLCFDNDDAGKSAIQQCVDLFSPGRLKIASLSEKDANECLKKGKFDELAKIVWNAQEHRPDGIFRIRDQDISKLFKPKPRGYSLPFPLWDNATRGCPPGRITTLYAKTGVGKTTTFKEILIHHATKYPKLKIAGIFLEESKDTTLEYLLAMQNNKITWKVSEDPSILTEKQQLTAFDNLKNVELYDHFGSIAPNRLLNIIEYWAANGVEIVYLDHITMVFSGLDSGRDGQWKDIDTFMTQLRSLIERTGIHLICATQLKRKNRDKDSNGNEVLSDDDARGCVDNLTEYLTPNGWKQMSDYTAGDLVGVYREDGRFIWEKALFLKKKADKFYHLKSTKGIDHVVSPEHKLLFQWGNKGRNEYLQSSTAEEFYNKHQISMMGHRGRFRTTFTKHIKDYVKKYSDVILRLQIAYQADGSYAPRRLHHVFKFKKKRKYDRLKALLLESGLEFKDYGLFNCGQYCIYTLIPGAVKEFPVEWYGMGTELATLIVDEIKYWDGEISTGRYTSTSKNNVDIVQLAYTLINVRSTISMTEKSEPSQKNVYRVTPSNNKTVCLANKDSKPEIGEFTDHDGFKYCFTTSTGMWISRRNGRIIVTGNSGAIEQLADFIVFLNRNKKGDNPNVIEYEINKNRYTGIEGVMDSVMWDGETGRLSVIKPLEQLGGSDERIY